jgi:cytochrome c oxidase subunit I
MSAATTALRRTTELALPGSTDHKRVALRLGGLALVFFLAGGVMALLIRTELLEPGMQVVSHDTYNELFSMHGSTMIYLFVTPVALALGVYLVPLQIGAAELRWSRTAALGAWLVGAGGVVMYLGFFTVDGADKAGWTAFDPLSNAVNSPGIGMDFWIFGVALAAAGSVLIGAALLATILTRRAPGMSMLRIPFFTWTMLVTALMTVASFPALIVAMGLLWVERQFGGVFDSPNGPVAYQHLFWFYGHPVVYVMFFPFVGAVAEVVSVFSGRRFFGYRAGVFALLAFTAISMSVWAHHMFATGQVPNRYFALTSTLLVVPAGVEYFDLLATMWRGRIRLAVPMLFALGFVVQFLIGGLTGIFVASPPLDYHVHDSYFVVAHFHYTLFAGSLFGFFAGVYYWFPKATGALLREGLGRVHFWLMALGANLTFFPMFLLGWDGMPRRVADYTAASGFQTLNVIASIGSYVIAISIACFIANVAVSLRRRVPAGDDPWGGHTLEWATTSPPPRHNFTTALPRIRSFAPLLDRREESRA